MCLKFALKGCPAQHVSGHKYLTLIFCWIPAVTYGCREVRINFITPSVTKSVFRATYQNKNQTLKRCTQARNISECVCVCVMCIVHVSINKWYLLILTIFYNIFTEVPRIYIQGYFSFTIQI